MKYFIPSTLLLLILLVVNLNAQQISSDAYNTKLIHENFNQEGEHFKIITTTDNYFILDNGDYLLSRNNKESEYAIIASNSTVSNFTLRTSIRIGPSENKKASVGIILKAQQDGKGAIIFEINKKGEYRIKQLIGTTYQNLSGKARQSGWVKSKLVAAIDQHNFIEIRSEDNIYDVYVNSEYLTTFFIPDYTNGSCGLIISPETKARVSYYYLNTKGESSSLVASYLNENTSNIDATIEDLNKKIATLEKNNSILNALKHETKENQEEIKSNLKNENSNLLAINIAQEKEIANLSKVITDLENNTTSISNLENNNMILSQKVEELRATNRNLQNISNEITTKNQQLNKQNSSLKQEIILEKSINTDLITDLEKDQKLFNRQITQLNTEIKTLRLEASKLKNSSDEATTNNQQLNKEIKALKQEVSLNKSINAELVNELEKINNSSNNQITQLNTKLKTLKYEVNKLETSNSTLSTDLSKEKSAHKQAKSGLSTAVKEKNKEIKELSSELNNVNNELNILKVTQATNNDITTDLNTQVTDLNNRLDLLTNQLNASTNHVNKLETTNTELKELFIQKDFELNGVKPSEMVKQTSNTPPAPKVLRNKKTFYTVQFGVFMQEQVTASIRNLDDVWYNTTKNGTYVYYSGEFDSPQEVTAHKNKVAEVYPNAFVVTLTK